MRKMTLVELEIFCLRNVYSPLIFARCADYSQNLYLCQILDINIPLKKIKLSNFATRGHVSFRDQQNKTLLMIDSKEELMRIVRRQKVENHPSISAGQTASKITQLNLHLETMFY